MNDQAEEYKHVNLRLERDFHRALMMYALDHEMTATAVIREALAAKLSVEIPAANTGETEDGQSESKGSKKGTRKASRARKERPAE